MTSEPLFDQLETEALPFNDGHTDPNWWIQRRADEAVLLATERTIEFAQHWAVELREAYLAGRPCPIHPTPEYKHVLELASKIAFDGLTFHRNRWSAKRNSDSSMESGAADVCPR